MIVIANRHGFTHLTDYASLQASEETPCSKLDHEISVDARHLDSSHDKTRLRIEFGLVWAFFQFTTTLYIIIGLTPYFSFYYKTEGIPRCCPGPRTRDIQHIDSFYPIYDTSVLDLTTQGKL